MSSGKRMDYTHDDRQLIIQYIIDKKAYNGLRGNQIWKEMEASKILKRTWQSLKEHFRTKVIHYLKFYNISENEQQSILKGYMQTKKRTKQNSRTQPQQNSRTQPQQNSDFSDEDILNTPKLGTKRTTSSSDSSPDLSIPQKKFRRLDEMEGTSGNLESVIGKGKTFKKQQLKYENMNETPKLFACITNNITNHPSTLSAVASEQSNDDVNIVWDAPTINDDQTQDLNLHSPSTRNASPTKIVTMDILTQPIEYDSEDSRSTVILNGSPTASQHRNDDCTVGDIIISSTSQNGNDDYTVGDLNIKNSTVAETKEFSLEEELGMVNYFRQDLQFFKDINDVRIYNLLKETTKSSRTSEELKQHFVKNVFPLLHQYDGITESEVMEIYKAAECDVSESVKKTIQKSSSEALVKLKYKKKGILEINCDGQSAFVLNDSGEDPNNLLLIKNKFPNISDKQILLDTVKYNKLRSHYVLFKKHYEIFQTMMKAMNLNHLSDVYQNNFDIQLIPANVETYPDIVIKEDSPEAQIKEEQLDSQEVNLSENVSQISNTISNNPSEISIEIKEEQLDSEENNLSENITNISQITNAVFSNVSELPFQIKEEQFDSQDVNESNNTADVSQNTNASEIPIQSHIIAYVTSKESSEEIDVEINIKVEESSEEFEDEKSSTQNSQLSTVSRNSKYLESVTSEEVNIQKFIKLVEIKEEPSEISDGHFYSCEQGDKSIEK